MGHAGTRVVEGPRPVVCAVDDHEWSHGAVDVAKRLAAQLDAPLVLVHARQPPVVPGASAVPGAAEELEEVVRNRGEELLAWIAQEHGLDEVSLRFELDDPGRCIPEIAQELNAQFIVVGSRGMRPLKAALLGSVSSELIARASCPVVVVSRPVVERRRRAPEPVAHAL
jgi:nucleotide-binding universal stress UspA family protein